MNKYLIIFLFFCFSVSAEIVQTEGTYMITEDISRNGVNSTFVTTNTSGVYNLRNTKPLPVKGANFIQKITFHQSYSYEEFIEGIKAEVVQDESDPSSIKRYVNYATKPGIFKTFCEFRCA